MPLRPPPDAEDKLRGIRSVTDAALSHLDADDLLTTLLDRSGRSWMPIPPRCCCWTARAAS